MRVRVGIGMACASVMIVTAAFAADLKSGPQPGAKISPFHPLNVTGDDAGNKRCLVWKNGGNPVAMIFANEVSDGLTSLVKKIDEATAKHSDWKMGSFVVFCSDDDKLEKQLKELADKEKIKKTILSIDNPGGPEKFKLAKDADVTVVLYVQHTVKANHAYKKGELNRSEIDKIMSDLAKLKPEKDEKKDEKKKDK